MKIRGENRQNLYEVWESVYKNAIKSKWIWKTGEKQRVCKLFVKFCEILGLRKEDKFNKALSLFKKYIEDQIKSWLTWNKKRRSNYIGFLDNKEEMSLFVAGLQELEQQQEKEIAGMKDNNDWEF